MNKPSPPDVSVVVPTYNRSTQLRPLIDALLEQETGDVTYEVIVVDNNSRDDTRAVVEQAVADDTSGRLQYVFEGRQGVSNARNAGIIRSLAPLILFLDDDGIPERDWVRSMKAAFDKYPDADCIGGRLRPKWVTPKPSWLSDKHWGPVALQDRPKEQWLGRSSASACLLTANIGFRRQVFADIGGFSPDYPRNQDRELELRMWRGGKRGLYLPAMDVVVEVPAERLKKRYHLRWQATTGKYHALLRYRDTVAADGALRDSEPPRRFLGSPLFLYRSFAAHILGWISALLRMDHDRRFYHESRIWYLVSFFWTRLKTDVIGHGHSSESPQILPSPSA